MISVLLNRNLQPEESDERLMKNQHKAQKSESSPFPPGVFKVGIDVMKKMMQYLAPRELLTLALTCKELRNNLTLKMVIRSVWLQPEAEDGSRLPAHFIMRSLTRSMYHKSIYPPSPLRILRLINVQRCEQCDSTDMRPDIEHGIGIYSGIVLCDQCIGTRPFARKVDVSEVEQYQPNLDMLRCEEVHTQRIPGLQRGRSIFVWEQPFVTASGERVGPILIYNDNVANFWRGIHPTDSHTATEDHFYELVQNVPPLSAYTEFDAAAMDAEEEYDKRKRRRN